MADLSNILFFKLRNNTSELWQSSGNVIINTYSDSSQCLNALRGYTDEMFFQSATLADYEGYTYLINLDNVRDYYRTDTNLFITFSNNSVLNVQGISAVQTAQDFQYLSNVYYNWNIETEMLSRNKKYIGSEYDTDITNGYFPDYATAEEHIEAGDLLVFSEGVHSCNITLDTPGVDIYAPTEDVIFENADNTSLISFKSINRIFGKGTFRESDKATITDGTDEYDIYIYLINYITLIDKTLKFYYYDDTSWEITISDVDTMTDAINTIVNKFHSVLATSGAGSTGSATSGIIYWVNCDNASAVDVNSTVVSIDFTAGETLNITYEDSTQAGLEYKHILFNFHNANLTRFISGKRVLFVDQNYTTDISADVYSTYTEAIAEAESGDVIYFTNSTYTVTTERFTLKNGVDVVCEDTIFNVEAEVLWTPPTWTPPTIPKALFTDGSNPVQCYVLGAMTVNYKYNDNWGWLILDPCQNNSEIYFSFRKVYRTGTAKAGKVSSFFHIYGQGTIHIKGREAIGGRVYDDDPNLALQYPIYADIDVLDATNQEGDSYIMLPYAIGGKITTRNGYFQGEIYLSFNETGGLKFINSKFLFLGLAISWDTFEYCKLWRCLFDVSGSAISTFGVLEIENYNQSYSNGTAPAVAESTETNPAIITEANIVISSYVNNSAVLSNALILADQNLNEYFFMSASEVTTRTNRSITMNEGQCFLKIKNVVTDDPSHANFDFDTQAVKIDIDCFKVEQTNGNENIFPIQNTLDNNVMTLRNGYYISDSYSAIQNNGYGNFTFNILNCMFKIPVNSGAVIYTSDINSLTVNVWNCYFSTADNAGHFLESTSTGVNMNMFGNVYGPGTETGSNTIARHNGDFVNENNIITAL